MPNKYNLLILYYIINKLKIFYSTKNTVILYSFITKTSIFNALVFLELLWLNYAFNKWNSIGFNIPP